MALHSAFRVRANFLPLLPKFDQIFAHHGNRRKVNVLLSWIMTFYNAAAEVASTYIVDIFYFILSLFPDGTVVHYMRALIL